MEARFLAPLPIRKMPGIGEVTERALRALGIKNGRAVGISLRKTENLRQWAPAPPSLVKPAAALLRIIDAEPKSISHNHPSKKHLRRRQMKPCSAISPEACKRLRRQDFPLHF
jgi:hypothetical protein